MALYNYIPATGVIVPDTSTLLSTVQNEYLIAFGQDLIVDPETPQGVLITSETLARTAVVDNNAQLANQINPDIAGGVFLDAICELTGLTRIPNSFTQVVATVTGVEGTTIPTSAIASLTTGEEFSPIAPITIGADGTATGVFQALLPGPIATPINTLTEIVSGEVGWETITNPSSAIAIGALQQSDVSLRLFRKQTLALQGVALNEAIISGLFDGLNRAFGEGTSLQYRENYENTTQVIDGVTLVANSIYVCVTNPNAVQNYTLVVGDLTGTPGTVIPAGSVVADSTPTNYTLLEDVILNSEGDGTGVFQSVDPGIFSTAVGDLATIVDPISGWSTVANAQPSTVYSLDFLNAVGEILLAKKSLGANWNGGPGDPPYGAYTVYITDPTSGQLYTVEFGTPTPVPVLMRVTVTTTPQFVADPITAVQDAILAYVNGSNGFTVGTDVSPWQIASAVNAALPGLFVANFEITKASIIDYTNSTIDLDIWEQANTNAGGIQVLVTNNSLMVRS